MSKVFVSYSRKDSVLVNEIVNRLMEQGLPVWQDKLGKSSGIPFSQKWRRFIEEAITRALGMIVFLSDYWEESKICNAEMKHALIDGIPILKVDLRDSHDAGDITRTILEWYNSNIKDNVVNSRRAELYGSMHSFFNNPRYARKYPGVKRLAQYLILYNAKMNRFVHLPVVRQQWKKYIHAILWRAVRIVIFLMLFTSLVYVTLLNLTKTTGNLLGLGRNLAVEFNIAHSSIPLESHLPYSPYQALEYIAENTSVIGCENSVANVHRILTSNMPVSITREPQPRHNIHVIQHHSRFEVVLSESSGSVQVFDKELSRSRTLTLTSAPLQFAWREDGQVLAISSNEKAYVWDSRLFDGQPAVLNGNIHHIETLRWEGNKVVAKLSTGQECTWDNPIPGPSFAHRLQTGRIVDTTLGPLAVYVEDNRLYVQNEGKERALSVQTEEIINSYYLDVSPDGRYAAIGLGGKDDWSRLAIVSLADGSIMHSVNINTSCTDLRFADEGTKVLVGGDFNQGFFLYDMSQQTLANAPVQDQIITAVCETANGYAAGDYMGNFHLFDKKLNPIHTPFRPSVGAVRQMVPAGNYLFFSSDVGNRYCGSAKVDTLKVDHEFIQRPPLTDTLSTTAVAADRTGEIVAFSYPNGEVWAFSTGYQCALGGWDDLGEKIIHLCFSSDSSGIYALGNSGTIYHLRPQVSFVSMCDANIILGETMRDYWYALMKQAALFHARGYDNGLTTMGYLAFLDSIEKPDATLNPDIINTK